MKRHIFASCMAVLLSLALIFQLPVAALAASASSEKEEVVYITLNADGTLKNTYVVNSFAGGEITDYGAYTSVKTLNVNDPIEQNGDTITISSDAEKVFYQGNLENTPIPWNISLRYNLDGIEYPPEELTGKSGSLKIHLEITKNPDCPGSFFEDYALQATFLMDGERFRDLEAPNATIANVGNQKQISYTVLPGKGIDTTITADVKNFEMGEVSINGIHLNLNVEIDDAELKDKVSQLVGAVEKLDKGASQLSSGSNALLNGSSNLKSGASSLHSGIAELDEGVASLQDGLYTMQTGLNRLNSQSADLVNGSAEFKNALAALQQAVNGFPVTEQNLSQLAEASGQIKQAVSELYAGAGTLQSQLSFSQYKAVMAANGLDIDNLMSLNASVGNMPSVDAFLWFLDEAALQMPDYADTIMEIKSALSQAAQVTNLFQLNNAALGGVESYLNGVSGGVDELVNGLSQLNSQYEEFDNVICALVEGLGDVSAALAPLVAGINQLVASYEKLDDGIGDYTDGVAQIVAGYGQITAGVSALAQGSKALAASSNQLYDGTAKLYDGVVSLCDGAKSMSDGTSQFRSETSGMNQQIDEEIDAILETIGGSMENPVSFVSEKNTNVASVQFVIRTDAVKMGEA